LCHTPPLIIAFYRQLFSATLLLPFVQNRNYDPLGRSGWLLLVLSGFFLAMHFATWLIGLTLTSVARATLFVDLQPIWAALFGALLLNERLKTGEIVAVVLVTFGGMVTVGGQTKFGSSSTLLGDLLAIVGGIAGAGYLLIGRKVRADISWVQYMFSVYWISAAWLLLVNLIWLRGTFPLPDARDVVWIILMAIVPSLIGHGLFNLAIRHLKAYVVNAGFLGEPIVATILAYFLFAEIPDPYFYAGASLVFAGLTLLLLRQRR
jgi:drug/metabolite transporter (DMT)-like permease